jgi:hypothetical protein
MAWHFDSRSLPLGRVQRDPGDQDRAAMEIPPGRVVGVVKEPETRESEKRSDGEARFRDDLNDLQRFAAIAETAAMNAYSIPPRVATSGRDDIGWMDIIN